MDKQRRLEPRDMAQLCVGYADAHGWTEVGAGWRAAPGEPRCAHSGRRLWTIRSNFPAGDSLYAIAEARFGGDGAAAREAVLAWAEAQGWRPACPADRPLIPPRMPL